MVAHTATFQLTTDFADFQPENRQYSGQKALMLAEACRLSEATEPEILKQLNQIWGFPTLHFRFINQGIVQGYVAATESVILLCFRGSDSTADWLTNLNFPKDAMPLGQVHRGWWRALDAVWSEIEQTIKAFINPQKPQSIWMTGHSLGGALATLSLFRLSQAGLTAAGLYTFGQPRVGNRSFAHKFDQHFKNISFRFVNNNDGVTIVPPTFFNYAHIGHFLYFTKAGDLRKMPTLPYTIWDFTSGLIEGFNRQGIEVAEDHNLTGYIQLLRTHVAKNPFA